MPSNSPRLRLQPFIVLAVTLALQGCALSGDSYDDDIESDTFDSTAFSKHLVLTDDAFTDYDSMSQVEIQQFLESTPWGNRSVLASHVSAGKAASVHIHEMAQTYRINPLVILTRAQQEQSLISKSSASSYKLSKALGCGCPDYAGCSSAYSGFSRQVQCMAKLMRKYLDALEGGGSTIAGWRVGVGKTTLDGHTVVPKSRATAALYTYTPWVKSQKLHASIWKKFTNALGYSPSAPNAGNCGVVAFGGVTIQMLPDDTLAGQYPGGDPGCFIDPDYLTNPNGGFSYDASVKLAPNFRLSEFANASPTRKLLLAPSLVDRLQSLRSSLGASINIELSYLSPVERDGRCSAGLQAACDNADFSYGQAVVVNSPAGQAALLEGAASVGFNSCAAAPSGSVFVGVGSAGLGCAGP